jgi:lipoprotein-releasing system permease protein
MAQESIAPMFQPLPLFLGLRYVRARQHRYFVSFITWVSLLGVALGVAALIVVLSVMNGFGNELRTRLLSLGAHARVAPAAGVQTGGLRQRLRALPHVVGAAPYLEIDALAMHAAEMYPVILRGIDPKDEGEVISLEPMMTDGNLARLTPEEDTVVIGSELAAQLGVAIGDRLSLLLPVADSDGTPEPRLREFTLAGVFTAGITDHDSTLVFAHLQRLQQLLPASAAAPGLQLRYDDALAAPAVTATVRAATGNSGVVHDWTEDHANYFRALSIEKTMMGIMLMLVVAVAAFNIVAMLVMVVNEKRTDIAILRTQGLAPGAVMRTFMLQGLVIGWLGVAAGLALGILLATHVSAIVPALERWFGWHILDADSYAIGTIPSELRGGDVLLIAAAALLLTLLATMYPARRAAAIPPAEALRYE